MKPRVCLLGFGEVGQTLARGLRPRVGQLTAWDLKFEESAGDARRAADALGVLAAPDAANAIAYADVVICAVTAAQILPAARSATALARDAWYFDLNSVSPAAKQAAAEVIAAAGGRFIEAAVMSPIQPLGAASPMLMGGEHAAAFLPVAARLGFTALRSLPGPLGSASAAKMCRSVIVKGLEALVLESLLSARRHGVEQEVLDSLRGLRIEDWREDARYMMSRALLHGARRAEEMREVARTVEQAGISPHMSTAAALWQDWAGRRAAPPDAADFGQLLDALVATTPPPGTP